ncbi:CHAT domain-containing protein [Lyngbya aestuarii]|uniref:CHAT domain-containing protein n=1 Tax=Lyngbya aestuarii TaxID=118322 RepID=UPI00403E1D63
MKLAVRVISQSIAALYFSTGFLGLRQVQAEEITPAADGTGTTVSAEGNLFEISGGSLSADGSNLFHSFSEFGLSPDQIANFLSQPAIQNILGRVTGGNASLIDGLIQVTGGNSNLFLMNPAGIVFGPHVQLNVPASFSATTATGIGFGNDQWFSAFGKDNYSILMGTPSTFAFGTPGTPGAIINMGQLAVAPEQSLTLLGGTVISVGNLEAPAGSVTVTTVPGKSLVNISLAGHLLSLEVQPPQTTLTPLSLPQLLTGSSTEHATAVSLNSDGSVQLTGSGFSVESGDLIAKNVKAQTASLSAFHNLTLVESQLSTTGDLNLLAQQGILVRDSTEAPFLAQAGGNLYLQGNHHLDIQALNYSRTPFQSGGKLSLVSDGDVSLDAHFASGGGFSLLNLSNAPTNFASLYDPIISAKGNVEFGDYTGVALKVEATGSIQGGNINIIGSDTDTSIPATDPHFQELTESRSLILQAGKNTLDNPVNVPQFGVGGDFTTTVAPSVPASIVTGNIDVSSAAAGIDPITSSNAGSVILEATGNITTGSIITTDVGSANSGSVNLYTTAGNISTGTINTSESSDGNAGDVTLSAPGTLTVNGDIITTDRGLGDAGDVTFSAPLESGSNQTTIDTRDFGPGDDSLNDGIVTDTPEPPPSETPEILPPSVPESSPLKAPVLPPLSETPETPPLENPELPTSETPETPLPENPELPTSETPETPPLENPELPISETPETPPLENPELPTSETPETLSLEAPKPPLSEIPDTSYPENPEISNLLIQQPRLLLTPVDQQPIETADYTRVPVLAGSDPVYFLEEAFTKEFENHFQRPFKAKINTYNDVRNWIRQLDQATGIKTGVIYASFTPMSAGVAETECDQASPPSSPSTERDLRFGWRRSEMPTQQEGCSTQNSEQLELVMVTAQGEPMRWRVTGASRDTVLATIQEFQQALTNPRKTNATNYLSWAKQLYQWLVAPLATSLESYEIQSLVFSMDEGLRSLPVAALHDGQKFLVERYSVSLVPSLSLTNSRYRDLRPLQVLAMGMSEFTDQAPLPGVQTELDLITEKVWHGQSFLNEKFTLKNFQDQRHQGRFGIVHLATHAEFQPGNPHNSYIQLWDRKLRLDEFNELQLSDPPVELLVLSACRTALGDREAELGFAGSALLAGVDSTLATLWHVSDQGALGLTTEFYSQLSQGASKVEALRQAQLAMIKGLVRIENNHLYSSTKSVWLPPEFSTSVNQSLSHPYYWAAFTLIGEPF